MRLYFQELLSMLIFIQVNTQSIGGETVLYWGARKCSREARAILIKILIFINNERQLTARAVPYVIFISHLASFKCFNARARG